MKTLLLRTAAVLSLLFVLAPAFAACPDGTVDYAGYCWVKPSLQSATHLAGCVEYGLAPTDTFIDITWDSTALNTVTAGFGYTSIGDYDNSAQSMWCNDQTQQCGTHNFGPGYQNYGPYDGTWTPIYTCVDPASVVRPADVPVTGPLGLTVMAALLALAGLFAARRLF